MKKNEPRQCARMSVESAVVPPGTGDRFSGYGVMGMPFASGHYLALRHFPASSIGPGYRAIWHRDPAGEWTVYADAPPEISCARFLGPALAATHTTPIGIDWTGDRSLTIEIEGILHWSLEIAPAPTTVMMSAMGAMLPDRACNAKWLLRPMGRMAGPVLSAGRVRLTGVMPAGQVFGALPRRLWAIPRSTAEMDGMDLGPQGPLPEQDRFGDFWLPQRALFVADAAVAFVAAA